MCLEDEILKIKYNETIDVCTLDSQNENSRNIIGEEIAYR